MALIVASVMPPTGRAAEKIYPGRTWQSKKPAEVGLNGKRLDALRDFLGGEGGVVRHGVMVYTWGDQAKRQDVASAVKPLYTHFLLQAIEEGKLAGLDELVVKRQPALGKINADLGHPDRKITFRHLATQTACYGLTEPPGKAFVYNDWQMALFFDTLFLKVYGATYENVDEKVLHARLTDPLGCQDNPTFLAFGSDRAGRYRTSVRDFARFGLLYLREGNWKGKQLVSKKHAKMAVATPLPASLPRAKGKAAEMCPGQRSIGSRRIPDNQCDHRGSYSFLWWTNGVDREGKRHWPDAPPDTYGAFGHGGVRAVVVLPKFDLVVSWNDTSIGKRKGNPENDAFKLLISALEKEKR